MQRIGARLARLIIKIVTFSNFPLTALLIFAAKTLTNALGKLQIRTYIFDTLSEGRGFVCNHYIVTLIKFNTSRVEFEMNLLSVRYLEMGGKLKTSHPRKGGGGGGSVIETRSV